MATPLAEAAAGLYLHIPFCSAICPYCDFAVRVSKLPARRAFVADLIAEIDQQRGCQLHFDTVYVGGGTPSLLEPDDLAHLLEALRRTFRCRDDLHLSLEANPEDIDRTRLAAWRRLGVTMLSLGVQSFDRRELAFLGRRHSGDEARLAVDLAIDAGFDTVSIDLIYGLPDQNLASWRHQLEIAVAAAPQHLSCYELEIHDKTTFGKRARRGELMQLPQEAQAEHFRFTHTWLADAGYTAYEVSNFASAECYRSRHNRKYWNHTPYLGLGPSAHSFDGDRRRWWNERLLPRWQSKIRGGSTAIAGSEILSDEVLALEALMLGLRTRAGIDLAAFHQRYGIDLLARNQPQIERWVDGGQLQLVDGHLRATLDGWTIADALAASFEL